jgi:polyphosphate kinase
MHAREKRGGQIVAKMNSLVDPTVIEALYRAADAGVKIQLVIRGVCCLVPRENIRVVSIVDRFLEHSRAVRFRNGGNHEVFVTSGDWMPRNFFRRIEVTFPITDPALRQRVERILETALADDAKSWRLHPDGSYTRRKESPDGPVRSQQRCIELARAESERTVDDGTRTALSRKRKKKKS